MEARADYSIPDVLEQLEEYLHSLEPGKYLDALQYTGSDAHDKGGGQGATHHFEREKSPLSIRIISPQVEIAAAGEVLSVDFMKYAMINEASLVVDLPAARPLEMPVPLADPAELLVPLLEWAWQEAMVSSEQQQKAAPPPESAVEDGETAAPAEEEPAEAAPQYRDDAILWNDYSSSGDLLNRRGFAHFLARSIDELWTRNWQDDSKVRPSTIFNIYGRWGSGKTTFVRMIIEELRSLEKTGDVKPWKQVNFNAWQLQHVEPIWWSLLERITAGLIADEPSRVRRGWMRLREWFWRVGISYGLYLMAGAAVLFLLAWLLPGSSQSGTFIARVKVFADGLDAVVAATSVGVIVLQSLLMGSASSARLFQMTHRDPMAKVAAHFQRVLNFYPNTPILVFIDDLDRCQTDYVVRLLECTQTLLSDKQVFYIVAADRKWISGSFDAYAEIQDERLSGGSHGYHFVEKIFQLSIGLPAITGELRKRLLRHLVNEREPEKDDQQERARAREAFVSATSEEELAQRSVDLKNAGISESVIAEEATIMSSGAELHASRHHRLTAFTELFEPNARSVKLVVNAYGVYINLFRTSGILDLDPERLNQIALWAILNVRFPRAAELIEADPNLIKRICNQKTTHSLEAGLSHPDIKTILEGGQTGSRLTPRAVKEMLGYVEAS